MEKLRFTTRVLGPVAAQRLEQQQVTQTLRSAREIRATLDVGLRVGDQMQVVLDDQLLGLAQYAILDSVRWLDLDKDDAKRGGFDNLANLEKALQRAGYRFQPIDTYQLYRLQFSWLLEVLKSEGEKR